MERISIPAPETNIVYTVNTFEELGNLRVIDLLMLLTTDSYAIAGRAIGIRMETFQDRINKNPSKTNEITEEWILWLKKYTHEEAKLWLILERNYGQTVKLFLIDLINIIELSEKNPSFFDGVSKEKAFYLKRLVYSDFFQSIKNGEIPTKWQLIKLTPTLPGILISFEIEVGIFPKLIVDFLKIYVAYATKNIPQIINFLRPILTNIFGQYAFEIHTHFILNWMNQEKVFDKAFPNFNKELLNNELSIISPESDITNEPIDNNIENNYTQAQQVLVVHFLLKFLNYNYQNGMDATVLTRIILMLTGKNINVRINKEMYDKVRKAPNYKSGKELIKDLKVVKIFFESINFKNVIQSIDNEIDRCNSDFDL